MPVNALGKGKSASRKEMYQAVLFGVTTGAALVQCLAWIFR